MAHRMDDDVENAGMQFSYIANTAMACSSASPLSDGFVIDLMARRHEYSGRNHSPFIDLVQEEEDAARIHPRQTGGHGAIHYPSSRT